MLVFRTEYFNDHSDKLLQNELAEIRLVAGNMFAKMYAEKKLKMSSKDSINETTETLLTFGKTLIENGFCDTRGLDYIKDAILENKLEYNKLVSDVIDQNKELFNFVSCESDELTLSELIGATVNDVFIDIEKRFAKLLK
jgi:hypothetical protein